MTLRCGAMAMACARWPWRTPRSSSSCATHRGSSSTAALCNEVEQRAWIETYFALPDDYYFVVERMSDRKAEGLVGIYDFDRATASAEWGRFVVRPGSRAAVEAALLVYRCGFETLGLDRMVCRTLAANEKVVAFHDSCGLTADDVRG